MALRYDIDAEPGDFSEWDNTPADETNMFVSSTNPIAGTYSFGISAPASVDPANFARNDMNALASLGDTWRVGMRFNHNDFSQPSNNSLNFYGLGGTQFCLVYVSKSAGGVTTIRAILDSGSFDFNGTIEVDDGDDHTIELRFVRAPTGSDGEFQLYVDAVLEGEKTDWTNQTIFDNVRTGTLNFNLQNNVIASSTGSIRVDDIIFRDDDTVIYPAAVADDEWDVPPMRKPASIDADAQYIYIAALDSNGEPALIQFSTALDADGSIVFQPGEGTDIGVECSATDSDVIWIAGDFDSTNTVERSTDAAASFVVEDPGTFAPVTAFDVGPDSDERVLVATETVGSIGLVNIFETRDGADNWTETNAGLSTPAAILAIDRLPVNPDEVVFGNANAAADRSDYSPNAGYDLDDITSGLPTQDATRVIIG